MHVDGSGRARTTRMRHVHHRACANRCMRHVHHRACANRCMRHVHHRACANRCMRHVHHRACADHMTLHKRRVSVSPDAGHIPVHTLHVG
eukprot:366067-Chlamydomonas_euryale.AAC.3